MSLLLCPICGAPLSREERAYRCPKGHSYDLAREGYVHLLPANRKHSRDPGDDREMAAARTRFLEGGWYSHLLEALCRLAAEHAGPDAVFLDAGCGEGYYTAGIAGALDAAGKLSAAAGFDLSKHALKKAARRTRLAEFAVASVYHLPVAEGCADLLLDCFAPLAAEEYRRALRPGGTFLYVVPAPEHLMEMKEILYDKTYENPDQRIEYPGFRYEAVVPVRRVLHLTDASAIQDLLGMTPYAWKTGRAGLDRLRAVDRLDVTAAFRIHVFRRES